MLNPRYHPWQYTGKSKAQLSIFPYKASDARPHASLGRNRPDPKRRKPCRPLEEAPSVPLAYSDIGRFRGTYYFAENHRGFAAREWAGAFDFSTLRKVPAEGELTSYRPSQR